MGWRAVRRPLGLRYEVREALIRRLNQPGPKGLAARLLLAAFVGLVVLLPALVLFPRRYTSRVTVLFPMAEADGPAAMFGLPMAYSSSAPVGGSMPAMSYLAVITSRRALLAAADQCGVQQHYQLPDSEKLLRWMQTATAANLRQDRVLEVAVTTIGTPRIRGVGDLLGGSAKARDAAVRAMAPALANALLGAMRQIAEEVELDRSKANLERVRERLATEQSRLNVLDGREGGTNLPASVDDPIQYHQQLMAGIAKLDDAIATAAAEVSRLQAQLKASQGATSEQLRNLRNLPAESPLLTEARAAYSKAAEAYLDAASKYGPESAQVKAAQEVLSRATSNLNSQARQVARGALPGEVDLRMQLNAAIGLRDSLQNRRTASAQHAANVVKTLPAFRELTREKQAQVETVLALQRNELDAELNYDRSGIRWYVLDAPVEPLKPSAPKLMLAFLAAVFAGLAVLLGPVIWRRLRDWFELSEAHD